MKLAVLLVLASIFAASGKQLGPPEGHIQIRLVNQAGISRQTLAEAEGMVDHILHTAGIRADWVHCDIEDNACRADAQPTDFWLQLLRDRPHQLGWEAVGYTVVVPGCKAACGYAAVSYAAVREMSEQWAADPKILLGAAMAHEIGHLLLGSQSHSHTGVMSPHFSRNQMTQASRGTLVFDANQAERLRGIVRERMK
jgi:hypothetical protein